MTKIRHKCYKTVNVFILEQIADLSSWKTKGGITVKLQKNINSLTLDFTIQSTSGSYEVVNQMYFLPPNEN